MQLEFIFPMPYKGPMHFYHQQWPVFHEDNHLLVLYKPAGLIVQRDHKGKSNLLDLAKAWVKQRYDKPGNVFMGMVHRLDGPVAGVIVLARTSKAASRLSAQFRDHRVEKRYLAVVSGQPPEMADRLTHWLVREGRLSRIAQQETPGCQKAVLRYERLSPAGPQSLVGITLETGRRHQIRAQMAAIGCPILGDRRYGAPRAMAHGRIALLAHQLSFDHPTKDLRLTFASPLPRGWPWPGKEDDDEVRPCWTVEDFSRHGLNLPPVST